MGYTTDFYGEFKIDPPLKPEHNAYLLAFAETRRMKLDPDLAADLHDQIRNAVGLPVGIDGEFVVAVDDSWARPKPEYVLDYNRPPSTQPGLWQHWIPSYDGSLLEWDGGEKFYNYIEWLQYLMENFFLPWGYDLSGEVTWQGEDNGDVGKLRIAGNVLEVLTGELVYTHAARYEVLPRLTKPQGPENSTHIC